MSDGPNVFDDLDARGVVSEDEKEKLLKAQGFFRELLRQIGLRLDGRSVSQVGEVIGIHERTARKRQRFIERAARKNVNRR